MRAKSQDHSTFCSGAELLNFVPYISLAVILVM